MCKIILKRDRDSRRHYEVTSRDIPNLSDRRSNARSRSSNIVARYQSFDKEKGEIRYNVTSQTKAGKSYTVSFRFKNWHPDMNHLDDEIQHSMKGDIEIDCTCPAFEFQGYKYLATLKGGSIEAERRPPDKTNRDRHGFACKHILKAIDSFNQDFDKFRSEGKGMIRKRNLRVQHKYESKYRSIRRRFESVSLGEELYNEITRDLNAFEERVQKRFEEICKNEYHYKRVNGHIAVEDGLETDDGNQMLCFYLFDKKGWNSYITYGDSRDSLSEVNYSFQIDGFYEDDEYFCGTTEKDLIEAVAEKFARDFDSSEY